MFVDSSPHLTEVLAYRGVHQTFSQENLENDTCTAERIYPSNHGLMENTIESMQAAFDAGTVVVELDIHLTIDKQFVVFHDWNLGGRTDGTEVTQDASMTYLKTLDIGCKYTSDGGVPKHPCGGAG